jgi:benzylsuccinate CoA-transferase BbsF subunit
MAAQRPLAGFRVIDFSWAWAGPYCTLQLAYLGAEVIRVESATRPCVTRILPPWFENRPGLNRSGYFNQYNQDKKSVALNLKLPEAKEVALRLIKVSDVFVNNFAGGVIDRMGFGYEEVRKLKPDIVMATLSAYGDTGPYRDFVGYGPTQVPLCGLSSLTGYKGWPPMHVGFSYPDPNGGIHGAFAILAALYHRMRTGEGQYLDMSQWECAIGLVAEGLLEYTMNGRAPARDGNRDRYMAPHGNFKCLDLPEPIQGVTIDRWVSIVCADDAEWARLAGAIGRPELAGDPRFATLSSRKQNEDELEAIITGWTSTRHVKDVVEHLQKAGVAAGAVADNKYLFEDPNLNARGYFVYKEHPEVGALAHCGIPFRMSATPCEVHSAAPTLGQHTDEVLTGLLGYSPAEVEKLRKLGALT